MGLIDVLTQYDARKKAAHAAKTVKHGVRCFFSHRNVWYEMLSLSSRQWASCTGLGGLHVAFDPLLCCYVAMSLGSYVKIVLMTY